MGKDTVVDWRLGSQAVFDKVVPLGAGHGELMCRRPGTTPLSDWSRSTAPHGQRTGVVQAQSPAARFARLSNTDKLGVALRSTARAVGPEMGGKLQELISPTNLAIVAGALAIWVGAHATPIGWVVDIGMVGLGAVALGVEAVNVMRELQAFAMGVIKAQSEADLAEAGLHLAKAIAIVGVDLVVALLLKKAIVKVRQPAMKGGEAADGTKLFGKYDPKDAARSLPAEASVAAGNKPLGTAAVANSAKSLAARRAYLSDKFGRTGNIDVDINVAGNKATIRQYVGSQGLSASDANALMTGIDLTQPVDILKLNPGKKLWQYQAPGAPQGKWYAFSPEVTPSQLGIGPYGINRSTMSVEAKVVSQYNTNQSVIVLRSTSKAIEDTWSISPYGSFATQGGARQLFSPQKEFFSSLPN